MSFPERFLVPSCHLYLCRAIFIPRKVRPGGRICVPTQRGAALAPCPNRNHSDNSYSNFRFGNLMHRYTSRLLLIAALACGSATCFAQAPSTAPATQAQIDALQKAIQNAQSAGDNAWMLVSAALVLL